MPDHTAKSPSAPAEQPFASRSPEFNAVTLDRLARVTAAGDGEALGAGLALVGGAAPRNEIEAALAVQLAGAHGLVCTGLEHAAGAQGTALDRALAMRAVWDFSRATERFYGLSARRPVARPAKPLPAGFAAAAAAAGAGSADPALVHGVAGDSASEQPQRAVRRPVYAPCLDGEGEFG